MGNLEKRYRWTYLQGWNRDAAAGAGHADAEWEGESGMNWEVGTAIRNTLCCVLLSRSVLSYPLCDPVDCSLPGYSLHGILWARILEGGVFPPPRVFPGIEPTSHVSCVGRHVLYR